MARKYRINNAGNQSDSGDLVDCHVEEKPDGSGWELVAKRVVLATSDTLTPPFTFSFQNYEGWNWNVTVSSITPSSMGGNWTNTDGPPIRAEGDSWTASGSGTGGDCEDEPKSAAAKQH